MEGADLSCFSLQVLSSVMSDKSLDRFRQEYEKLHTALKKVRCAAAVVSVTALTTAFCATATVVTLVSPVAFANLFLRDYCFMYFCAESAPAGAACVCFPR